jgi:hypothetical protein
MFLTNSSSSSLSFRWSLSALASVYYQHGHKRSKVPYQGRDRVSGMSYKWGTWWGRVLPY